jgi:transcription-repair coupling factor (superfamily II helicase)
MAATGVTPQARTLGELSRLIERAEGFPAVLAALSSGHSATIGGTWGSSCALVAATLGSHVPRTLFVITPHVSEVDDLCDDISTFLRGHASQRSCTGSEIQTAGDGDAAGVHSFLAWEKLPREVVLADEIYGQRLRLLNSLSATNAPRVVVASIQAMLQPVPSPESVSRRSRQLQVRDSVQIEQLLRWLVDHGFVRRDAVEMPGEFGVRGGILDVFPPDQAAPLRIEFFGDEIESIRSFDIESQRSDEQFELVRISAARPSPRTPPAPRSTLDGTGSPVSTDSLDDFDEMVHPCAYVRPGTWFMLIEPRDLAEQGRHYLNRLDDIRGCFNVDASLKHMLQFPSIYVSSIAAESLEATCHLRIESIERFSGELGRVKQELDDAARSDEVLIACHNEAEMRRLVDVFSESEVARADRLHFDIGSVRAGFRIVSQSLEVPERGAETGIAQSSLTGIAAGEMATAAGVDAIRSVVVIGNHELFHRESIRRPTARRRYESRAIDSFLDLDEGDLVVHLTHGIAIYRGMQTLEKRGQVEEHLMLEFAESTRIFVPVSKIELVQKYVGGSKSAPTLSRVGTSAWEKRKDRVAAAVIDMASDLIDLQAVRASQPGIAYPEDSAWQHDFEAAFPYQETDDQLRAIDEIRADMARSRPMDRLICGDVGYGKTEIAMRAAFKTVDNGKQVAVLVPTTVLAEQHYRTFTQRMAEFPFGVEVLSRFKTKAEQRATLERLAAGQTDIIIGTHRLVQNDVSFNDLGLVIIDEEQRFGVEHKEKLKALRRTVDVLTLTATPIPRTLHMSLLGIRDISNLETPPHDRLAIETRIARFDPVLLRNAIIRELNRDGQVYFVHNRVHSIWTIAQRLQEIVPEATILVGHGQMGEHELEKTMLDFVEHRADILVATTIIESGLDIPNVNTIFINDGDRYGLADLHQLRGRVGRYKHRAYAYILLDPQRSVTPQAAKRMKAIEEFSELGAGFKIAMRDLEIRGAGNILGSEQSGHIASVGYELYCQLLDNAVRSLKHQPLRSWLDVTIEIPLRCFLPRDYVPGLRQKIEVYRKLARLRELTELEDLRRELEDRFGRPPEPAENLLQLAELRILAEPWQIDLVRLDGEFVQFGYRDQAAMKRLTRKSNNQLRVADSSNAYLPLAEPSDTDKAVSAVKTLLRQK